MKVMFKLVVMFLAMSAVLGYLGYVEMKNISVIEEHFEMMNSIVPVTNGLNELRYSATNIFAATEELLMFSENRTIAFEIESNERKEIEDAKEIFEEEYATYSRFVEQYFPDESGEKNEIGMLWADYIGRSEEIINMSETASKKELFSAQLKFEESKEALVEKLNSTIEHEFDEFNEMQNMSDAVVAASLKSTVIAIWIFVIVSALGVSTAYNISRSIIKLRDSAEELGRGNLDAKVNISSKDDFGELAASFNQMALDLKKLHGEAFAKARDAEEAKSSLQEKVAEMEKFNKMAVGRELRMAELKKRIAELEGKHTGQ